MGRPRLHGLLAGDVVSRRGWRAAALVAAVVIAAMAVAWWWSGLALVLGIALVVTIGIAVTLGVWAGMEAGERRDADRLLAEAEARLRQLDRRNRELAADLSAARLDADTLRAGDVPDAATPELAAQIDGRPRACERESEPLPCRRPVVPPHTDPPYRPTPTEAAAWRSIVDHIRREASS